MAGAEHGIRELARHGKAGARHGMCQLSLRVHGVEPHAIRVFSVTFLQPISNNSLAPGLPGDVRFHWPIETEKQIALGWHIVVSHCTKHDFNKS